MVEVRDAATVMLVRDGDAGMEVLMLMRNLNSDFVGGAYVFPGGAVDPHDRHEDLSPYCLGRNDAEASERLGISSGCSRSGSRRYARCFEEAGILLAYNAEGDMVRLDDPAVEGAVRLPSGSDRQEGARGSSRSATTKRSSSPSIASTTSATGSRPRVSRRRYRHRFLVTRAPDKQVTLHATTNGCEHVDPVEDALDAHEQASSRSIFPTIKNLSAIARSTIRTSSSQRPRRAEQSDRGARIVQEGEQMRILLPGDPGS